MQRLWLQSMTPKAIRDGVPRLRSDNEMRPLADAAVSRSEADWLVGINSTRALTAFNSQAVAASRRRPPAACRRRRWRSSRSARKRSALSSRAITWKCSALSASQSGQYRGRWFDRKFAGKDGRRTSSAKAGAPLGRSGSRSASIAKCTGKPGIVQEEKKPTTQALAAALRPYDAAARSEQPFWFPGAR